MKAKLIIFAMLSMLTLVVSAQTYRSTQVDAPFKSHQIMNGGALYQGTVYEPFGTATPAEASYSPAKAPSGPRKGFIDPSNPGSQSEEYPIGDAALPLLLMALAFAGVIFFRKRHANVQPYK